jgi:hypothetical protein
VLLKSGGMGQPSYKHVPCHHVDDPCPLWVIWVPFVFSLFTEHRKRFVTSKLSNSRVYKVFGIVRKRCPSVTLTKGHPTVTKSGKSSAFHFRLHYLSLKLETSPWTMAYTVLLNSVLYSHNDENLICLIVSHQYSVIGPIRCTRSYRVLVLVIRIVCTCSHCRLLWDLLLHMWRFIIHLLCCSQNIGSTKRRSFGKCCTPCSPCTTGCFARWLRVPAGAHGQTPYAHSPSQLPSRTGHGTHVPSSLVSFWVDYEWRPLMLTFLLRGLLAVWRPNLLFLMHCLLSLSWTVR